LYTRRPSPATDHLKYSITKLYAAILVFLGKASHYYDQNTAKRLAKSFVKVTDLSLDEIMRDVRLKQSEVERDAQLVDAEYQQGIFRDVNSLNASFGRIDTEWSAARSSLKSLDMDLQKRTECLRKILSDLDKPLYRIGDQLTDLHDGLQRSERLEVIQWLSTVPYPQHHQNVRKDRLCKSGLWMLRKEEFLDWKKTSTSAILWLHGIPGSGKSKLA
jgi:hypothetical protein